MEPRLETLQTVRPLLRPSEVAAALQVSVRTVYGLIARGVLRACRIGLASGTIRVHPEDLDTYVIQLRAVERRPPGTPLAGGD